MGCTSSKEVSNSHKKITPENQDNIKSESTTNTANQNLRNDTQNLIQEDNEKNSNVFKKKLDDKEILKRSKDVGGISKPLVPSIPIQKPVAFDIILDDNGNAETIDSSSNSGAKLILPKLQPLQNLHEDDTEELKRRIKEKEAQAALNRQNELAKKQNKVLLQEEKSKKVLEKKRQLQSDGNYSNGSSALNDKESIRGQ